MKWVRTLLLWTVLFGVFTAYSIHANVFEAPISPQVSMDRKVLYYNFSMSKSSAIQDNFTLSVFLDRAVNEYVFHVYTNISDELNSISALGQYSLSWTLLGNGIRVIQGSYAQVWSHTPYGVKDKGNIPDKLCCSERDNFTATQGSNEALFSFRLVSNLTQYGQGFYWVALGPFVLEASGKIASIIGGLALEAGIGALLLPVSHYIGLYSYRLRRKTC